MTKPYNRLDKDNAAVLLVDHQTGLLSLVRDFDPDKFKNNVLALADLADYFNLPTILTTSFEDGPNGPIVPELKEKFPKSHHSFRAPVRSTLGTTTRISSRPRSSATCRKQLIIAGVVTEGLRRLSGAFGH